MRIEDFYNDVAVRVPSAPPQLIESASRNALSKFFRNSLSWRQVVRSMRLKAARNEYDLRELVDAPVCAIIDIRVVGSSVPLVPTTVDQMVRVQPDWFNTTGDYPVRYVAPDDPGLVQLYPTPRADGPALTFQVALYPNARTAEIPEWVGQMFYDDIVEGICAVLYRMPKKDWSDMNLAIVGDQILDDAARTARGRVEKSNTQALMTAVFTPFDRL